MTAPSGNPWIARLRPPSDGPARLVCLPHAGGGGATFRGWVDTLPDELDMCVVRLPGRESRLREPQIRKMDELVAALAGAVAQLADRPYALFGYCSGALTAFELIRHLAEQGSRLPQRLFVAACPAPASVVRDSGVYAMPRPELIEHLRALGIVPPTILADEGLFSMFEDSVRADYETFETADYRPGAPLSVPVSVFGADHDPSTTVPTLLAWQEETSRAFTLRLFRGDHSFFEQERAALSQAIAADLRQDARDAGGAPGGGA